MASQKPVTRQTWFSSLPGRLTALTGVLVAFAALINGGIDLINTAANVPIGQREKLNYDLFRENFGKKPIVEQPLEIATANMKVQLVIQVFPSGDAYVRYGNFEQWLPFKSVKTATASILPEAFAQSPLPSPSASSTKTIQQSAQIYIDLDKLKQEQAKTSNAPPVAEKIEKTYVLAEMKDDHPYIFERSVKEYSKIFQPEPGYRFSDFTFVLGTSSHYSPGKIEIAENGNSIVATFKLRSGSAVNRYPGWVQGTLRTEQTRRN